MSQVWMERKVLYNDSSREDKESIGTLRRRGSTVGLFMTDDKR